MQQIQSVTMFWCILYILIKLYQNQPILHAKRISGGILVGNEKIWIQSKNHQNGLSIGIVDYDVGEIEKNKLNSLG